ncbi:Calmodulin-like protein 5 (Calmodulin-like skin protein) [Durusdinium trenchii]|uniref:Calmodulin-like protein 5 (Calmodulin-like skin protein) n=1 Tax=Durusdinium trenchii TaxID=1381693 RepID=A0ABP0KWJ9_9DINO
MVRCRNLTKVLILAFLFRQLSQAGHGALLGVKSGWKWWPKPHHEPQPPPPAEEPHHTPDGQHEESIFEEFVDEVRLCPWLLFAEISTVVVLGALFEQLQHWVREHLDHSGDKVGMQIMDVLFREFSGLGFIGMFLFLVTQSHITADVLGKKVFGHHLDKMGTEDPIAESFETVHMMIFLLMAVLLFQAMAMLRVTQGVIETWGRYERCRSWGLRQDSLESLFCDGGYLERVASKTAPRGLELKFREDFTYQEPFLQWMMLHHDLLHNLVMWRAIRHQFIFGRRSEVKSGQISCPRQFSFESYLRERLGHIVVCVVEVDRNIWLMTLLVLTPSVLCCVSMDIFHVGEFLCLSAYFLLAMGVLIGHILETDTLWLTPILPTDARKILILFSGTSTYMLMKQYDASTLNAELKFGAPGLQGLEAQEVELGKPPVSDPKRLRLTSSRYAFLFELLAFWQAIQVTCLVLYYLTVSFDNWHSVLFYALAWAEWPLMLFGVMPVLLERLTLRSSIGEETDENLVRMVSLETKAMMLRYHVRLAQLKGFEERQEHQERQHQEKRSALSVPAAEEGRVTKTLKSPVRVAARAVRLFRHSPAQVRAEITWQRGLRVFRSLPYSEQFEIEQIFSSLDINNNEEVMLQDLAAHWKAMGFSHAMDSAEKLLASIDYDGSGQLTWSKFQAVAALATSVKGDEEDEDYRLLFRLIDRNQDGRITVFEIASWLEGMKSGMTEVDVASLLYQHFGQAKPSVDTDEFARWIASIGLPQKGGHGSHGSH